MNFRWSLVREVDLKIRNSIVQPVQSRVRSIGASMKKWGWSEISR
jgi:hypothetical protein